MPTMRAVPWPLMLALGSSATASAQSPLAAPIDAARYELSLGSPAAPTSLADAAKRQARLLVTAETAAQQGGRAASRTPNEGAIVAFALGSTVGAIGSFAEAGRVCHCESSKAVLIGGAIGGVAAELLYRALTK